MKRIFSLVAAGAAYALANSPAFAHAFLDHAVPGVGTTVGAAPGELDLTFTEKLVPAFSGVRVARESGALVAAGRPSFGPPNTMHLHLSRVLSPGTYIVSWHVVSVDTHRTQGTYKFTIAP